MVVTYHKINQYAEDAGSQGRLIPELALWLPFLAFAALIAWMYHVISSRPGGQPIGAGVSAPGAGGAQTIPLDRSLTNIQTVAITQEPAGGSPAPTSAVLIAGNL